MSVHHNTAKKYRAGQFMRILLKEDVSDGKFLCNTD